MAARQLGVSRLQAGRESELLRTGDSDRRLHGLGPWATGTVMRLCRNADRCGGAARGSKPINQGLRLSRSAMSIKLKIEN